VNWLKRSIVAVSAVGMLTTSVVIGSVDAVAAYEICNADHLGENVPVVKVHGLGSQPAIMDPLDVTVHSEVEGISTFNFDYEHVHNEWVTHEDIGPKLARYIDCLAQASLEGGGKGKVIVLAHSMGGLATRYAVNETVDERLVADEVGLVITIGTPHWGSDMAKLCESLGLMPQCRGSAPLALRPDSSELANLPEFPDSIPVRAIAGDVTLRDQLFETEFALDLNSDVVVNIDSATAFSSDTTVGDGESVFECDGKYSRFLGFITGIEATCEHTTMLSTDYIQEDVVQSIEAYLASIAEPEFDPNDGSWWTFFDKLAIPYLDQDWGGAMSEPEYYVSMRDYTNCTDDTTAGCPSFYFTNLDTIPSELDWDIANAEDPVTTSFQQWCDIDSDELWSYIEVGVMVIGDKIAEFHTLNECPGSESWLTMRVWYVEDERVLIQAWDSGNGTIDMEVMEESFRQAVWF